jgi:putative acetyltransferase
VTAAPENRVVLIQAALPEHIEQTRALFLEYAQSLGFSLCFQSFDEELKSLPGAYAAPSGRLLLAQCGQQAAGCVALRRLEGNICEMKRLYVRPAYRGQGLGRILVERVIAEARGIGYERMRLDTIASSMKDAVELYRRMGFE